MLLLTRDQFRENVLRRDHGSCVICGSKQDVSVHHIMERRLFNDGGYYEANGATLCEKHHMEAEQTVLTCDAVRRAAKIREICLPEHLDSNRNYDKWGNQVINDNLRYAGELFYEEPVQKILGSVDLLKIFPPYIKYPRTQHLPFSENLQNNDRKIPNLDAFQGKEVVVTEKLDGEGTSCYRDYIHARSIDSKNHPSRNWMKAFHATFKNDIPEGWRVCGELLYARHSIAYDNLDTFKNDIPEGWRVCGELLYARHSIAY